MGVPALFRWLSKKYPKIIQAVEEEEPRKVETGDDGVEEELPIDMSRPNPNGEEFDCLYLDMNGIVHPCTHPEGKPAPETEEDMMLEVFKYTERVVNMVRPRRLLMMAIDGVAPRAKMNQQRSRRFRTAQEAKEKQEEKEKALEEWKAMGIPVTEEAAENKKTWDSNAITPGTPFMDLLASSLRYWVARKMNQDPAWKNLQVIISDASVPGEGEHKIMDFIRRQRSHAEHNPNTKHVIYGLDADLIMLSLATHEPYFKVLREDVFADEKRVRKCHRCGREGHIAANCIGEPKEKAGNHDDVGQKPPEKKPFIFLDVPTLREYLEVELNVPGVPFKFDLERAIDDWVFLIFFVGNDFLPHLPSLEIREGAIDSLLKIWKAELGKMGGYLTKHGKVEMKNVQVIMEGVAAQEDDIFRRRKEAEERADSNAKRRKVEDEARQRREMAQEGFKFGEQSYVDAKQTYVQNGDATKAETQGSAAHQNGKGQDASNRLANLSAAEKLKAELKKPVTHADVNKETEAVQTLNADATHPESGAEVKAEHARDDANRPHSAGQKRSFDLVDTSADETRDTTVTKVDDDGNESVDPIVKTNFERKVGDDGKVEYEDTVKMWEPGYRERYYRQKFGVELSDTEFRRNIVKSYMEGMSWVLAYYYQGCPSWTWYYPYHFSPFAADFTDLDSLEIKFDEGEPFRPYDQLMGVLPAASRASIPKIFHSLMTEPDSEIIDFYPEDFAIDMNGKKMAWQGVALLPFIDEKRLLAAINARYNQLSPDELRRNAFGDQVLLVAEEHQLYDEIGALYAKRKDASDSEGRLAVNATKADGTSGFIRPDPDCVPGSTYNSPLTSVGLEDLLSDRSISALYDFPPQRTPHRSVLLKGVQMPKRRLTEADREITRRGGPDSRGGRRGGGPRNTPYNHHSMHADNQQRAVAQGGRGNYHNRFGGRQDTHQQWGHNGGYSGGPSSASYGGSGGGYGDPMYQGQQAQQGHGGNGAYSAYGGQGAAFDGYGGAPPSYGGYGGNGLSAQAAPPQQSYRAYGAPQAYGDYGGQSSAYGAPAPLAAGQYGQYGGYGGSVAAHQPYGSYPPAAPPSQAAPPSGPRHGNGGGPPRPLGLRGGRGPPRQRGGGGPYGRY